MSGLYSWVTSSSSSSRDAATPPEPEENAATPDDAATTPEDDAQQRHSRAALPNPYNLRARTDNRSVTPQQRLRDRIAARSPSPSPAASTTTFTFPAATMDADAIRALVQETLRASTTAAVSASVTSVGAMLPDAVRDVMRDQVRDVTALTRKPELPAFDTANIEIWIRQIENSFTRASITAVKDKFAFLKAKLGQAQIRKSLNFSAPIPSPTTLGTSFSSISEDATGGPNDNRFSP